MENICAMIGCSGMDKNCPGNPMCSILIKLVGNKLQKISSNNKYTEPKGSANR